MGNSMCSDTQVKESNFHLAANKAQKSPVVAASVPKRAPSPIAVEEVPPPMLRRESATSSERTLEWSEPNPRPMINLDEYNIEPEGPITPARPPPPHLIESWFNATPSASADFPRQICDGVESQACFDEASPRYAYEDNIKAYPGTPGMPSSQQRKKRTILEIIGAALA